MEPKLDLLRRSFEDAPVVRRGEYDYFIHPLSDSIPPMKPELVREVCQAILDVGDFSDVDLIITVEAMGIHIGAVLSQMTGLPFYIVRKRQYWMPGEIILDQSTGYSKGKLYINGLNSGMKVLVVDAVISTGGTYVAILNALKDLGVKVKDIVAVIERGDGVAEVKEKTGIKVKTLIKIEVEEGKVKIIPSE
ncbi:MAG: hypoxanthine/guanine phosphoribosyltransferase [Candidatus Altiarchaeota archaeon]